MSRTVRMPAKEIVEVTVDKVSLVKHAATRSPFKILKAEAPDTTPPGVLANLKQLFAGPPGEPQLVALLVKREVAKTIFPLAKKHGFRVEKAHADLDEDVVILKQEGFTAVDDIKSVVALSPEVAVGLDRVVKDFDCWHSTTDFDENIRNQSFYPCVRMATDTFHETLWAVMADAHTHEDAVAKIDTLVKQFSTYVKSLLKALPSTVFKMEADLLPARVGGNTVASANVNEGEQAMADANKPREVMKGDLAGLFDEPSVQKADAAATGDEATTAAATSNDETATTAAAEGAATGDEAATAVDAAAAAAADTPASGDGESQPAATDDGADAAAAAVAKGDTKAMVDALTAMTAALTAQTSQLAKMDERLTAVEKAAKDAKDTAAAAVAKAEGVVVVRDDVNIDQSFATPGMAPQRVRKADQNTPHGDADDSVWAGAMPGLSEFIG